VSERLVIAIEKKFQDFDLKVNLSVCTEILVLFGPSGAGKTQTLNALAGLMTPDRGEITLDGESVFRRGYGENDPINLPARERRIAMVFQQYALFPHLTARQNIGYPVRDPREARRRANELLDRLNLEAFADRYPHELSGGQQQRIAIARALAANAKVLLLDEPFSALDRPIREQLHHELMTIQEETGLVVIYVTHSLDDALTAGQRLAIINKGRIEQVAEPDEIFTRPRNRAVLEILGVPNICQVRVVEGGIDWDGMHLVVPTGHHTPGDLINCYIAAEDILIIPASGMAATNHRSAEMPVNLPVNVIEGRVLKSQPAGLFQRIRIEVGNNRILEASTRSVRSGSSGMSAMSGSSGSSGHRYGIGERIHAVLPPDRLVLL
jgi:molybdate transport system ATP-binding protein